MINALIGMSYRYPRIAYNVNEARDFLAFPSDFSARARLSSARLGLSPWLTASIRDSLVLADACLPAMPDDLMTLMTNRREQSGRGQTRATDKYAAPRGTRVRAFARVATS